jgi:hypothetical protein
LFPEARLYAEENKLKKKRGFLLTLCMVISAISGIPSASGYVQAAGARRLLSSRRHQEMTLPSYWTIPYEEYDALLCTAEEIAKINSSAVAAGGAQYA